MGSRSTATCPGSACFFLSVWAPEVPQPELGHCSKRTQEILSSLLLLLQVKTTEVRVVLKWALFSDTLCNGRRAGVGLLCPIFWQKYVRPEGAFFGCLLLTRTKRELTLLRVSFVSLTNAPVIEERQNQGKNSPCEMPTSKEQAKTERRVTSSILFQMSRQKCVAGNDHCSGLSQTGTLLSDQLHCHHCSSKSENKKFRGGNPDGRGSGNCPCSSLRKPTLPV